MADETLTPRQQADADYAAGRYDIALEGYRAAASAAPQDVTLPFNIGNTLKHLKRFDEAIAAYDEALAVAPAFPIAHHNKATCLLQLGDLRAGFAEYEWRKACPGFSDDPRYALPRPWRGEPLAGKRLYIFPELFQGDLLQFGRYAILVTQLGARPLLAAPRAMHEILRGMGPMIELVDSEGEPPDYDFHCALMSLPMMFGTTLETVPSGPRYFQADPRRVERWRARIGGTGFKVGIAWQGSAQATTRSFPLAAAVEALGALPGVRLISLQKHNGLDQLAALPDGAVETLGDDFDPGPDAFLDTAAAMMSCDLFVSADTSVTHLAGGLGVPTWLANPWAGDWRWLEGRSDTPWYPSVRIFRQAARDDWPSVFAQMAEALRKRLTAA